MAEVMIIIFSDGSEYRDKDKTVLPAKIWRR